MEQNKDGKEIDFPALTFTPDSGSGYTDDEGDSEMKSATSKVLMKTPNRYVCCQNRLVIFRSINKILDSNRTSIISIK